MFSDSNFWLFLFSFLPGIIYSLIIYLSIPNSVRLRTALNYVFFGLFSGLLTIGFNLLFPNWQNLLFIEHIMPGYFIPTTLTFFLLAFFQVALVEECSKWAAFRIGESNRQGKKHESPFSTIFYSMMIALGFAGMENIMYAFNHGPQVLLSRNLSAVIIHMTAGIFMGYYIAMGRRNIDLHHEKTPLNIFLKIKPKWKVIIYNIKAILVACLIHGIYDWNLMASHENRDLFCFLIIALALYIAHEIRNKLLEIHNKELK